MWLKLSVVEKKKKKIVNEIEEGAILIGEALKINKGLTVLGVDSDDESNIKQWKDIGDNVLDSECNRTRRIKKDY